MNNIGGALDYKRLAELNKPHDVNVLANEVRRLAGDGYTPNDISSALKMNPVAVREILARAIPQ